jgi:3-oxoacyl-[acyl-carrier protein] reductase
MSDTPPLRGKTALVTGSSSGIGRAIAIELARNGANIILHGRSKTPRLTSVYDEVVKLDVQCNTILADFAADPNWDSFVDEAWSCQGDVDFWINNAGGDVLTGDWPNRTFAQKLEYLWQVDVAATLMLSRGAGERMKSSPGSSSAIVNMGWDQAWQGMAGSSAELFSTTKGAIMSMTKSLAQSLSPEVRVNCLAPGWIKTQWGNQASEYWSERARHESLMNRWGTPQDVANVAAYLCSESASFISGQIIPVNGGFRYGDHNDIV